MPVSGGDILLDLLQTHGIEYIFCSPGTEWTSVWEGILKRHGQGDKTLKYINCRHEMLAVSMAMGYAETTGKLPAVLLHSGAGTLHGSMAIRNAYTAQVPMIVFSGETYEHSGDPGFRPQGPHWIGLLSDIGGPASLVRGCTKWNNSIKSMDGLVDAVYRGCRIARTPPRGPVFISILSELLQRSYTETRLTRPLPVEIPCILHSQGLEEVGKQLVQSRKPVIIAENPGKYPGTVNRLIELSELVGAPVFESLFPFCSSFPKDHPLYLGFESGEALQEADMVLVVGGTTPWYPPSVCRRPDVKIIWLDEAPLHENLPYWGYQCDISLTVDIERGLSGLVDTIRRLPGLSGGKQPSNQERLEHWRIKHDNMLQSWEAEALAGQQQEQPLSSKWFLYLADKVLPRNSIILDETMMHFRFVNRYLAGPGRCYTRCGYGGIGVGLGEAAGVKLANPDRPVVLFIGDGAFNYNPVLAGLGVCQEYHLPVLIVIMNNGGYFAMKLGHNNLFPGGWAATHQTYLGVDITPAPDYTRLAEAFGAYGEKLTRAMDIEAVLKRGLDQLSQGKTSLLDVVVSTP